MTLSNLRDVDPLFSRMDVPIVRQSIVQIGKPIIFTDPATKRQTMFAHPIDVIWLEFGDKALVAHEKAMDWIVGEAERKFDLAIRLLR